jgi:WD40 repeat protein
VNPNYLMPNAFSYVRTSLVLFALFQSFGTEPLQILWTKTNALPSISISPDGRMVATATGPVHIRNVSDGEIVKTIVEADFSAGALRFSPDGSYLAASGSRQTVIWNTRDWQKLYTFPNINFSAPPAAFSPVSPSVAVGSSGPNGFVIELHSVLSGQLIVSWTNLTSVGNELRFSPDGSKLAAGLGLRGTGVSLSVFDPDTGNRLWNVPTANAYGVGSVTYSHDGRMIATGSDYMNFYGPIRSGMPKTVTT